MATLSVQLVPFPKTFTVSLQCTVIGHLGAAVQRFIGEDIVGFLENVLSLQMMSKANHKIRSGDGNEDGPSSASKLAFEVKIRGMIGKSATLCLCYGIV